jgi:hypothetical protein
MLGVTEFRICSSKMSKCSLLLRHTPMRVARILVTAALLAAFLGSSFPLTTIASGPMCTLACCAGRAPHAAGSCMNGSCHANLRTRSNSAHIHRELLTPDSEQMCGLQRLTMRLKASVASQSATVRLRQTNGNNTPDNASLSETNLGKPCLPECGSCASGFTSPGRKRNAAALAYAIQPRPPSNVRLADVEDSLTRKLTALCRQCAPRAPPLSLS